MDWYLTACKNKSDGRFGPQQFAEKISESQKKPLRTARNKIDGWIGFLRFAGKNLTVWLALYNMQKRFPKVRKSLYGLQGVKLMVGSVSCGLQERIWRSNWHFTICRKIFDSQKKPLRTARSKTDGWIGFLRIAGKEIAAWFCSCRPSTLKSTVDFVPASCSETKLMTGLALFRLQKKNLRFVFVPTGWKR